MKIRTAAMFCFFLLLTLTACARPALLPEPTEERSAADPNPGIPAGYNLFHDGDLLLFSAFGAGLLSAAALIEW